ncbi:hypothetical protein RJ639_005165 [Escallonia herrerae]|uniref:DUF4283 domain-containing protein n=1 Tax=Escallonia herrerae TaxID=1293975 RepID=A0AA88W2K4_9ASTE|nr:hypothetical protein RJ639_005165 [Escallonia herrerae]
MDLEIPEDQPSDDEEGDNQYKDNLQPSSYLQRIRQPWNTALIIKVLGASFTAATLEPRLMRIFDLPSGYYTIKFTTIEDYRKAPELGPWFLGRNYLSVQKWVPNFNPANHKISTIAVWIRLNGLPIEYYDKEILTLIGKK